MTKANFLLNKEFFQISKSYSHMLFLQVAYKLKVVFVLLKKRCSQRRKTFQSNNHPYAIEIEIKDFLGIEIALSKKGIVISQQKCVIDLLKETGMSGCRLADTPIDPNQKLEDDKEGNPV
jgi:hypothetical protein